ncbi:MAG TPA: hypothetical protein VFQ39_09325 [Longimicrobium sp.]|nr:hypothetical protein [Longimicrobium sp.]
MQCLNCGGELPGNVAVCPHCGFRRRSRLAAPEVWQSASLRTRATVVGLVIAAVIVCLAAVMIVTNHRGGESGTTIFVTP